MFDTYVTLIGNVLTLPEWRRTTQTGVLVANFKVASTSRRLNRESGQWVDGNSLRVRVNCWRKLAEGVASSVAVGDPVVVFGRMYTRDWTDEAGNHRTLYELEAVAVGHDLSRGRGRFLRNKPVMSTSSVEDAETETRIRGEQTDAVPDEQAPALPDGGGFEDDFEIPAMPAGADVNHDTRLLLDRLPGDGARDSAVGNGDYLGGPALSGDDLGGDGRDGGVMDDDVLGGGSLDGVAESGPGAATDGGDGPSDDGPEEVGGAGRGSAGRGRRARGRVPVPA